MSANHAKGIDADRLRAEVETLYARLAAAPQSGFDFNRGMRFAADVLNYAPEHLARVPRASLARFAGRGNPHRVGLVRDGETVLDAGCGAGTDLIIAAHATGPAGRVIGVDLSAAMIDHAWKGAGLAGVDAWTTLLVSDFCELPVDSSSVDVVLLNGALNLAVDKQAVLQEFVRVLKPGGRLYLAEAVVSGDVPGAWRTDHALWAQGLAGALAEKALCETVNKAGFTRLQVTERFDCFRDSRLAYTQPTATAVNLFARKPLTSL